MRGKTEREAIEKAVLKKRDIEEGKVAVSSNMTVSAWAYKAVDTYKTNQKEITKSKYVDRMRHCILEQIGNMPLKSVKPIHCQEVLNRQTGKSKTQVNEVYQTLKFIFSTAYNNGLLAADPSAKIVKPSYITGHRRAITDQERAALLQVAETDPRFNLFLLMLFCGCRPSEAMAAQGQDIQQIDGYPVLHIRGRKRPMQTGSCPFLRISIRGSKKRLRGAIFASRRQARRTIPYHIGGYFIGCAGK